jgi:RNA polymerase-binding transcription factor DksA
VDNDFLARTEKSLLDLKQAIVAKLVAGNADFMEIMEGLEPKDQVDAASDDIDRKMIEAVGAQEVKRFHLIDSTLTRIRQGKYGLCIKCGKQIPQARLEALPYALMCVNCKQAEEKRNR